MTEADILATTYDDRVTVYRPHKEVLDTGESIFRKGTEGKMVYQETECALSTHSGGQVKQTASIATAPTTYCLFTRPEVDIQENDFLVILHLGKVVEAIAGRPERMVSHNNVPIKMAEEIL